MFFNDVINIISLIASSFGLLILMTLAYRRPKLMKRVSLQLQTGIALLDITRHIQLYNMFSPENSSFCTLTAFYGFFSDQLYVFLNVAIALNLHLFLLKQNRPKHFVVWAYFIASAGVSLAINSIPLGFGYLGKSSFGSCYLKPDIPNQRLVKLFLVQVNWPGIIYCLTISFIVISQYIFGKVQFKETETIFLPEVRGLSCMISLNSLSCFLTMFIYLLNGILIDWFDFNSKFLFGLAGFGLSSTGLLNLVCLLLDYQIWFALINCATPHRTLTSSSYELTNNANNGQSSACKPFTNPILVPTESQGAYDIERDNLINFL